MFINVAAVISKYCFPEYCNLATSVSCMQMIIVKITACEMYWNGLHLLAVPVYQMLNLLL